MHTTQFIKVMTWKGNQFDGDEDSERNWKQDLRFIGCYGNFSIIVNFNLPL